MIHLDKICKKFDNTVAVDNLSLTINEGEIYGLLGANGAGKSTTINLLLGFISPDSGIITLEDKVNNKVIKKDQIGYIPENVNLYPYLTGLENLDYFSKIAGLYFEKSKLMDILSNCSLDEKFFDISVSNYSKGMRQKVGIAIAYAKNAKVYLLDEPASGLDPFSSNQLSKILINLKKSGAAIFMASHDIFRVRETCDKIGILKNGKLIKEMYSKDVTSKQLENIYLEYMKK
tara:strand:- start:2664 stop:3359 length:696 start_codon:yes stop_codon:yes gene_type:complete